MFVIYSYGYLFECTDTLFTFVDSIFDAQIKSDSMKLVSICIQNVNSFSIVYVLNDILNDELNNLFINNIIDPIEKIIKENEISSFFIPSIICSIPAKMIIYALYIAASSFEKDWYNNLLKIIEAYKDDDYYEVRERFNQNHNPLDFLFLNRSCFNGMIRFNKKLAFNVPYGHKPQRFSKAYITKITNQVTHIEELFRYNNWSFICQSFEETIKLANEKAFIYCDPPYIGRHVDYYDSWDVQSEMDLCKVLVSSNARFMLSTWDHNDYRKNDFIDIIWNFCSKLTKDHFYFVGAKELNRKAITEALLTNYVIDQSHRSKLVRENKQLEILFS